MAYINAHTHTQYTDARDFALSEAAELRTSYERAEGKYIYIHISIVMQRIPFNHNRLQAAHMLQTVKYWHPNEE